MAMSKEKIIDWLDSLPEDAQISVDGGGLCLRVVGDSGQAVLCDLFCAKRGLK